MKNEELAEEKMEINSEKEMTESDHESVEEISGF